MTKEDLPATDAARLSRLEAVNECIQIARKVLPAHDDQSCCFGLRQNILSALQSHLAAIERS